MSLEWDPSLGDKPSELSSASELKVADLHKLFPKLDKVLPQRWQRSRPCPHCTIDSAFARVAVPSWCH